MAKSERIVGYGHLRTAFQGGTLVPTFDILVGPLATNANGAIVLSMVAGGSTPAAIYYQYWVTDSGGPSGYSASNGIQGNLQVLQ